MTDAQLLVGSLSNDLFRVASLTQRGSTQAALRFLQEAKLCVAYEGREIGSHTLH